MKNLEIRQAIKDANLKYWQIASEYGLSDGNFSRLLRKELPTDKKKRIISIINNLSKEEK